MKLSIIIVNYKTKDLLEICLNSILMSDPIHNGQRIPFDKVQDRFQQGSEYILSPSKEQAMDIEQEIIVIDNHSEDGTVEMVKGKFPGVCLLVNETNLGYARAVNQGIRIAKGEYILLLNPDIQIKGRAIQEMVRFMDENERTGIVGAKLLNPDGTVQYSCRTFYTFRTLLLRRTPMKKLFPNSPIIRDHLMMDWDHASVREVDWVLGACMLVRRKTLEDVGAMDERFFLYFEDVDWCYRMKKANWKVYYFPHAEMIHEHRRESAQGLAHPALFSHLRSLLHFYDKWSDIIHFFRKYRGILIHIVFALFDLVAVTVSFYIAYQLRKGLALSLSDGLSLFLQKPDLPFAVYKDFLIFVNVVTFTVFHFLDLYKFPRGLIWVDELFRVIKGVGITTLFIMAGTYLAQGYEFSRSIILIFGPLGSSLVFLFRFLLFRFFKFLRKQGFDLKRILILGTGLVASTLKKELGKHQELGYDVVGFVAMSKESEVVKKGSIATSSPYPLTSPILGTLKDLPRIIKDQKITEIIITELDPLQDEVFNLVAKNNTEALRIRIVTDVSDILTPRAIIEELAGIPTIAFEADPLRGVNLFLKRALDLVLSVGGIIFLLPLFFIIGTLIKGESSGPVLLRQERIGRNRQRFLIYRFRCIYEDQDIRNKEWRMWDTGHEARNTRQDPTLTRVGRVLRRFRLDELPQLINVMKGEMSLVGPRPSLPKEVERYEEWQYRRLWVRPGITGLWQISGRNRDERSAPFINEMTKLDLYYIRNWSLSNDLKIILRTLPLIFLKRKEPGVGSQGPEF